MIPSCLEEAFSSDEALDRCFSRSISLLIHPLRVFSKAFRYSELVTDDVDENEKELKFLLLFLIQCSKP